MAPEASADNGISVGCQQPSDRMRINTTDLNYTATRKNTSYTTAVSCDLEGRSGVLLMPSAGGLFLAEAPRRLGSGGVC